MLYERLVLKTSYSQPVLCYVMVIVRADADMILRGYHQRFNRVKKIFFGNKILSVWTVFLIFYIYDNLAKIISCRLTFGNIGIV